jgi:3-phytase
LPKQELKTSAEIAAFNEVPIVGFTEAGDGVRLGGFSALQFVKKEDKLLFFKTITDRGANAGEVEVNISGKKATVRPFLVPEFAPSVVDFSYDVGTKKLVIVNRVPLKSDETDEFTGIPPKAATKALAMEIPVDSDFKPIDYDENGADTEGFCMTADHRFVADEYGPSLMMFNNQMILEKEWVPGNGLPLEVQKRKVNHGFEGLACDDQFAYVMLQTPLKNEESIRLLKFDWHTEKTVGEYFYPVNKKEADKIGDIALLSPQKFLAIEQNGKAGPEGVRRIYLFDLQNAGPDGLLKKEFLVDLNPLGLQSFEKIEGITVVDSHTIALVVDNDFGLTGEFNKLEQKFENKKDPRSYFILVHLSKELPVQ